MSIWSSIAGPLISGGTGLLSGVLGNIFAKQDFKRQIQASKELAKYQMDLQQQAIDTQNEYNLPKNQMARLQDAGLNPHLVYGSGSVVGNSSSAASPSIPTAPKLQRSEILRHSIDAALQTAMMSAQVKNMDAQNANIREQNRLLQEQVKTEMVKRSGMSLANSLQANELSYKSQTLADRVKLVTKDLELRGVQIDHATQSISIMKSQANEIQERINNMIAQRALTGAQLLTELKKPAFMDAQVSAIQSQVRLNAASINLIGQKVIGQVIENGNNALMFDFNKVVRESMDDLAEFWNEHPTLHQVSEVVSYYLGSIGQILGGAKDATGIFKTIKTTP